MSNPELGPPSKSDLPIVTQEVKEAVFAEILDNPQFFTDLMFRLVKEQSEYTETMSNFINDVGKEVNDKELMTKTMLISYRLLEAQAEVESQG